MTSEWTIDTIKEHFEALRAADQRAVDIAMTANEKAVQVALQVQKEQREEDKRANDHRFETGNNQRGQAADERHGYMTIAAFEQYQRNLSGDNQAGKTGVRGNLSLIGTAIALIISLTVAIASFLR
jgi:hypothetical protein